VYSLPESTATSSISAVGLVPHVSFSKACTDPGTVLTQAPPAGTQVAPSSTVNITVDSGTRTTCVLR
jgi:beta-lactam-binding protein with PASTA domain